jgi:hypothetical protein
MRIITWVALLGLAAGAASAGSLRLALLFAGTKAALIGAEYMELRWAHRAHALGFALGICGWVGLLVLASKA